MGDDHRHSFSTRLICDSCGRSLKEIFEDSHDC